MRGEAMEKKILVLENINKSFPGVRALADMNLSVLEGEVHGLAGENGAGKSTLMKILSGSYKKDSGRIVYDGDEVEIVSPKHAEQLGISIIYQELNLIPRMSVAENIYVGRQPLKFGLVDWKKMRHDAQMLFDSLELNIDIHADIGRLSIANQQMVEIAKAVSFYVKVVIMDEPTSSLTKAETDKLFNLIENLRKRKIAVIFITHRMDEIFTICDRITVMRDGQHISTQAVKDTNKNETIAMMIGRNLTQQYPTREPNIGDVRLSVSNLSDWTKVNDVSFDLCRGEVLGFAGLVGAGRTETMRMVFGADKRRTGEIVLDGKKLKIKSPRDGIRNEIGFVTEDRKEEGLLLSLPVKFNMVMVALRKIKRFKILNMGEENRVSDRYIKSLHIATPSNRQTVMFLSGGNQQKVVIAKWLFSDSKIIIMDEPTRGIDVGAKREIYEIINGLVGEGRSIIVVSSEMEELMGICDRIIVMKDGRITGQVDRENFSQRLISEYMIGGGAL